MARRLRFIPPGSLVEITTRTIHARYLLRPSAEVNDIILGIIGRAQTLYSVRIHAFVVLSNHWHALLSVDDAAQLAAFAGYVNGNIAREIGRLHNWRDRFWSRRYSAIVVADEESAVARLRYVLQNGCKEGLVERPADWPGVSCVRALVAGRELCGTWYDRTAEYDARRRGQRVAPGRFASEYRVELSPLPCWRDLSPAQHRAACADLVRMIEDDATNQRSASGSPVFGASRVLAQDPHDRPTEPHGSSAPLVHASSRDVSTAFRAAYAEFIAAFRAAAASVRRGIRTAFPVGAFPPGAPFVSAIPAPG